MFQGMQNKSSLWIFPWGSEQILRVLHLRSISSFIWYGPDLKRVPVSPSSASSRTSATVFSNPLSLLQSTRNFLVSPSLLTAWCTVYQTQLQRKTTTISKQNLLAQDVSCNWRWRLKVPIHEAICWLGNVPIGHIVEFTTHTLIVCISHQLLYAAYYRPANSRTIFIPSSWFLFLFLEAYYILLYVIPLYFLKLI
jgi:hypothetical protein